MSDVQLYLIQSETRHHEAVRIAERTAQKLESKELKLITLVESLGEYLNNDDVKIRAKTMSYLSDVLSAMPPKVLSRQQRDLLNDFILSRVSNGAEGLVHCSRGLLALEKLGRFDDARVDTVMETFLEHTHPLVQFKLQSERFAVLTMIDLLIAKYRNALRQLSESNKDFLPRLIAYFDGEKDPRNLMVVFSILNVPMVEWDVSAITQDMFDAVFNYFPITFRPPPDDPYGITAQDLKDRLRDCIASTSTFAPYAFPNLLDKLDSTSINVKRDALQAIAACVARYGPGTVSMYSVTLWDALKFEVLNALEDDLSVEALSALTEMARQLSCSSHDGPLQTFINPIVKECNEYLEDTPTKQSSGAGRILKSISQGSSEASNMICKAVLPQIFALYKAADTVPRRRGLLEILNQLIEANLTTFGQWRKTSNVEVVAPPSTNLRAVTNEFAMFGEMTLRVLTVAVTATPISEVSFRLVALQGIRNLAMVKDLLGEQDVTHIIRVFDEIVTREESYGRDELKAFAIDALVELAHQKPQLLMETTFPDFMALLPETDVGQERPYVPVLEAFAKLSAEPQIFKTITVRLKNKLYSAARQDASSKYVAAILAAMLYAFTNGSVDLANPAVFGTYYSDIVVSLLKDTRTTDGALFSCKNMEDSIVLDLIGRICNVIMRKQAWVAQTEVSRNVYTLFKTPDLVSKVPFNSEDPTPQDLLISTHLLASLQREAKPHTDINALLKATINYSIIRTTSHAIRQATIRQISLIVNKFIPNADVEIIVSNTAALLTSPSTTSPQIHAAFAILRAAVFRTHRAVPTLLSTQFLPLLTDPTHGPLAASLFSEVLAPDDILTKQNNCQIFNIHKQRFFALTIPYIVQVFKASEIREATKRNILVALSGILYWIPYDLLSQQKDELQNLAPLLLQSLTLDVKDAGVKGRAIALIERVLHEDSHVLEGHVGSLASRLLNLATSASVASTGDGSSPSSPPRTRAASLSCLASFVGSFRVELLQPLKYLVSKRLMSALDDPKRAVRTEAVRCRRAWMGVAGTGDDDDD